MKLSDDSAGISWNSFGVNIYICWASYLTIQMKVNVLFIFMILSAHTTEKNIKFLGNENRVLGGRYVFGLVAKLT